MDSITPHLQKLFDHHRIVFWYDEKQELRHEFAALELPGVKKIELTNNEFMVKHHLLREYPHTKFLVYKEGSAPLPENNWLLDVELAHGVFRTDKIGIWASEIGLDNHYFPFIEHHYEFFTRAVRRNRLAAAIQKHTDEITEKQLKIEMLGICCGTESNTFSLLEALLKELYAEQEDSINLLQRSNLLDVLYALLQNEFSYQSRTPSIKDFLVSMIDVLFRMQTDSGTGEERVSSEVFPFASYWKNSKRSNEAFEGLIQEVSSQLQLADRIAQLSLQELQDIDYFPEVDRFIIGQLVHGLCQKTISFDNCLTVIRKRETSYWYKKYTFVYQCISYSAKLLKALERMQLTIDSTDEGIQRYANSWFSIDQHYRKAVYYYIQCGEVTALTSLWQQVEQHYTNGYVLKLNDLWQHSVNAMESWKFPQLIQQHDFYKKTVGKQLEQNRKIIVVISDALRYEAGEELQRKLLSLDKFEADIKPMVSMLPSYTQLGMASLLPHKELEIFPDDGASVLLDGKKVLGTEQRQAVLQEASSQPTRAIRFEEIINTDRNTLRDILREQQIIYIYHNQIDAVGDKRDSEHRCFTAVEQTLEELVKLVQKLTSANATQIFITADHGFLYQHNVLDSSDFVKDPPESDGLITKGRRYMVGKNLASHSSFISFTSEQLGLSGNLEVQIPKSINRLRIKGSGSRYVHGGASLQEIVVPLVTVKKIRFSTNRSVDVEILRNTGSTITSGQISITFYQKEPVSEKVEGRELYAGFYYNENKLISNTVKLNCTITSENPRDREIRETFIFTQDINKLNGQKVNLVLSYAIEGTTYYQSYAAFPFMVQRAFTSDFDF